MSRSAERWTWPSEPFLFGANLPWIHFGCDFGANAWFPDGGLGARPDALARLDAVMDRLVADRVSMVRLFLLCDLRAGVRFDAHGDPVGLDDAFFRDVDALLETAVAHGVRLLPVLLDFHLCGAAHVINGVQVGGRGLLLADPVRRAQLISTVVRPIAERCGEHPAIAAWDLFNEPEWCTRRFPRFWRAGRLSFSRLRECLEQLAEGLGEAGVGPALTDA